MVQEEIHTLSIIFNIRAHVVSDNWKDFHVYMLLQFVGIEGMTLFPLWVPCTLLWHIENNIVLILYHFLTIIGQSRIGKLKQITRNFLCIEVEGVQTDFIMRWTFVILTNLADVDYATNLGIIGEIVQILNQDSTRRELCNFYYCCCNLVFILYCYLAFNSYLIL